MIRSRGLVLGAFGLVVVVASLVMLVSRFATGPAGGTDTGGATPAAGAEAGEPGSDSTPTSDQLIGEALEAGDVTYEESLLFRAYAIFDDARLEQAFRTQVPDWEAASSLFEELERPRQTLSAELLAALVPFRVRPSDPRSIVNRPRTDVTRAQLTEEQRERLEREREERDREEWFTREQAAWSHRLVSGTNVRIWTRGADDALDRFEPMVRKVWGRFPNYFPHPLPDNGPGPISEHNPAEYRFTNPDSAIDVYFVNAGDLDPRCVERFGTRSLCHMTIGTGVAKITDAQDPYGGTRRTSGYSTIDMNQPDHILTDTIAHEIAHASQRQYDSDEKGYSSSWVVESTATWVAFRIVQDLKLSPDYEHEKLESEALFRTLHQSLPRQRLEYSSYLFFFHASLELGDRVVQRVWEHLATGDGIQAVDKAIPLAVHFPRFTVRNWNQDGLPEAWRYKTHDPTFPSDVRPGEVVNGRFAGPGTEELTQPVPRLGARYYRFTFDDAIRRVTFENLFQGQKHAHVWALTKIGADWNEPQDWTAETVKAFCRDEPTENVTELVVIVSNTEIIDEGSADGGRGPADLPPGPRPIVLAEDVGCPFIEGWSTSRLRLRDDAQDVSYVSSRAPLRFRPRTVQDQPGNVQYDLLPTSLTWTVSGRKGDCTVAGQAVVDIPGYVDQSLDPTRLAWGYLNVVGLDGGDFHSVRVQAVNPDARMTVTCPGKPPRVSQEPFKVVWLLHVLSEKNSHSSGVTYTGKQTFDFANPQANMPMSPGEALKILPNAPLAGAFITPEIQRALKEAQEALDRIAAESGGQTVYTFEWELKPTAGAPPPGANRP